jgi:hypothetical protein
MASRICFNRHQKNQSSSDHLRRKKAMTLYTSPNLEGNIISDTCGCLLQTRSYETLLDITKGGTIYNNIYASDTDAVTYSGESYQMYYTQKDLSGEILITSNYGGSINQLDPTDDTTVVIDLSNTVFNQLCGSKISKTIPDEMIRGDLLNGFAYPNKIQLPRQSSTASSCLNSL